MRFSWSGRGGKFSKSLYRPSLIYKIYSVITKESRNYYIMCCKKTRTLACFKFCLLTC